MRALKKTNDELEKHGQLQDKEKDANVRLREELEKLREEKAERDSTSAMKLTGKGLSKACVIQ
jgi:hypothetical protein